MKPLLAALLLLAAPAAAQDSAATPATALNAVIADHWQWYLQSNPVAATALGVRTHDDRLADLSLAEADRQAAQAAAFIKRLDAIPAAQL